MTWLAVAVGGAVGSVARYAVGDTMTVNLVGCLIVGVLAGSISADRIAIPGPWRELVFVGLLGGFTTFSAFGLETFMLARTQPAAALTNVLVQVVGGMVAVWVGYVLTTR
jgi:fluoride exporter